MQPRGIGPRATRATENTRWALHGFAGGFRASEGVPREATKSHTSNVPRAQVVTLRRLQELRDLIREAETHASVLRASMRSGHAGSETPKLADTLEQSARELRRALPYLAREAA